MDEFRVISVLFRRVSNLTNNESKKSLYILLRHTLQMYVRAEYIWRFLTGNSLVLKLSNLTHIFDTF